MTDMLRFDLPKYQSSIIKVIGVGGGGSNAVTHMYKEGIKGVDFIICNTDAQAMESSPVPTKIQLGANLTSGLGAGSVPTVGRNAALENVEEIRQMLTTGTKMVFITAGLGGGTGTGAAPVIAQIAKEMEILTVGIVTIPFAFEGNKRRQFANEGIRQMKQQVDALLIISNDKLRELCGDLRLSEAFKRADNVLTTAAKGIAEIITVTGYINVDFEDVKTVMKNSGVAIMGTGIASGENRAELAVEQALSSPLLDNNDIEGASNMLLYITSGAEEITMDEVTDITNFIQRKTKMSAEVIWGNGFDESLEDKISVTIIATGFDSEHRKQDPSQPMNVKVHSLYDEQENQPRNEIRFPSPTLPQENQPEPEPHSEPVKTITEILAFEAPAPDPVKTPESPVELEPAESTQKVIVFEVESSEPAPVAESRSGDPAPEPLTETPVPVEAPVNSYPLIQPQPSPEKDAPRPDRLATDRVLKLRALSEKLKIHPPHENSLQELEDIPAYKRRNVELNNVTPSSESQIARYSLSENPDKTIEIRSENSFLHKNVD